MNRYGRQQRGTAYAADATQRSSSQIATQRSCMFVEDDLTPVMFCMNPYAEHSELQVSVPMARPSGAQVSVKLDGAVKMTDVASDRDLFSGEQRTANACRRTSPESDSDLSPPLQYEPQTSFCKDESGIACSPTQSDTRAPGEA